MRLGHHHSHGFHMCRQYGSTPAGPLMPLSMAAADEEVAVKEIRGGAGLRRRLADLGLNVGTPVRVVRSDTSGQLIVALKGDSRLALGCGMAHRIMVEPLDKENE